MAGVKTAWCAQHSAVTLAPTSGRNYELASISGGQSAGIVEFLIEDESPSNKVKQAVCAAAKFFENAMFKGWRVKCDGKKYYCPNDK